MLCNNIHFKNLNHGCNYLQKTYADEPSVFGDFNFMEHYKNLSLEDAEGEIWKDIPGYEGYYQVSNLGRIKSNHDHRGKGNIVLRQSKNRKGYLGVKLYLNSSAKEYMVHRLVMLSFVGESDLQIDHLNEIKTDNLLENLEYVTNRENTTRRYIKNPPKDLPTGVHIDKKKYCARILVNKKYHHLGVFKNPEQASSAYQTALSDLDNIEKYSKKNKVSKYGKGVYRNGNNYSCSVRKDNKNFYLGTYKTIEEAKNAIKNYKP